MPEGNTALAQAAIYLATAPKSNAVYLAYSEAAERRPRAGRTVALHIRNAPTRLMKELDYGKGYKYAHDEAGGIADMDCLPPSLSGKTYYEPTDRGFEDTIRKRLEAWKQAREEDEHRLDGSRAFVAHFLGRRMAYTYEIAEYVPERRLVTRGANQNDLRTLKALLESDGSRRPA